MIQTNEMIDERIKTLRLRQYLQESALYKAKTQIMQKWKNEVLSNTEEELMFLESLKVKTNS